MVVDVPASSNHVLLGAFLSGTGEMWFDDVSIEAVGTDVPLTGPYTKLVGCGKKELLNLDFEKQ